MENKTHLNPSTSSSTGQDGANTANTASTDSGNSHYGLKGDTIGTKDAFCSVLQEGNAFAQYVWLIFVDYIGLQGY